VTDLVDIAELHRGRAAEHLVVADLLLRGHNAFLAAQGMPYDVVVDITGRLIRVQVKSCATARPRRGTTLFPYYRFQLRHAKGGTRHMEGDSIDVLACVALDSRRIGYFRANSLLRADGRVLGMLELRSEIHGTLGRSYPGGTRRSMRKGRFIEQHTEFPSDI
jgi:hypothetical protein